MSRHTQGPLDAFPGLLDEGTRERCCIVSQAFQSVGDGGEPPRDRRDAQPSRAECQVEADR